MKHLKTKNFCTAFLALTKPRLRQDATWVSDTDAPAKTQTICAVNVERVLKPAQLSESGYAFELCRVFIDRDREAEAAGGEAPSGDGRERPLAARSQKRTVVD